MSQNILNVCLKRVFYYSTNLLAPSAFFFFFHFLKISARITEIVIEVLDALDRDLLQVTILSPQV